MAPVPGLLYVTMQPHPDLSAEEFHDWYNNEHGPTRLRLPFVTNGFRYRATDLGDGNVGSKDLPEWMALYDITDNNELNSDAYLSLRGPPLKTERETNVMKRIDVDRKCFDAVFDYAKEDYKKLEDIDADEAEGTVLVAAAFRVKPGQSIDELDKWYKEEHIPMLSKVPGWRRSRCFKTSLVVKPLTAKDKAEQDDIEYLSLHEYAPQNGMGSSPEFKAATSTPWRDKIMDDVVRSKSRRVYKLAYTFGPAPRYLSTHIADFSSPDGATKTIPTPAGTPYPAAIESFVTTPDGVVLPYRLEGSSDPDAPLIVLVNSVLVDYYIWDDFIHHFFAYPAFARYRVLRYNARSRSSAASSKPVTVDLLASDVVALLDALRVPKAAAVVGVSLGGATALDTALKYPHRVQKFVACDTNAASPAGNAKAWGERIQVAEEQGTTAAAYGGTDTTAKDDEAVVGEKLAELTVRRWFVPESYDGKELEKKIEKVKAAVERNSLEGFKTVVRALFEYDFWAEMKEAKVPGAFLVGAGDGKLPAGMKEMAEKYGKGGEYYVVDGAGHLPMVEKPEIVAGYVSKFLTEQ